MHAQIFPLLKIAPYSLNTKLFCIDVTSYCLSNAIHVSATDIIKQISITITASFWLSAGYEQINTIVWPVLYLLE